MIVHAGRIKPSITISYLLLYEIDGNFVWKTLEGDTDCSGSSVPKAIAAAGKKWALDGFRTLHCGFRYTLPTRDEVGRPALFWEMVRSYETPNQSYFDEAAGHPCYVYFASHEALELWQKIKHSQK